MEKKLKKVFKFLKENRCYNRELQTKCYIADISPYDSTSEKVLSILYRVVNTQSGPNMDKLSPTFRMLYEDNDLRCLDSFNSFVEHISNNEHNTPRRTRITHGRYDSLYHGMKDLPGWGPKTAALFVKSIYHIHHEDYNKTKNLKIWGDAPKKIDDGDKFRLPVDKVMVSIFKEIHPEGIEMSFSAINRKLSDMNYSAEEIEVWDDLWFWGYITQKTVVIERANKKLNIERKTSREIEWNENKYWALRDSDKNSKKAEEIERKAKKFIEILTSR